MPAHGSLRHQQAAGNSWCRVEFTFHVAPKDEQPVSLVRHVLCSVRRTSYVLFLSNDLIYLCILPHGPISPQEIRTIRGSFSLDLLYGEAGAFERLLSSADTESRK